MRLAFLAAALLLFAAALPAEMRKWTSQDGRFSTEAELVDHNATTVTLKKPSGETVSVPLAKLSDADRRFVLTPPAKSAAAKPASSKPAVTKPTAKKPAPGKTAEAPVAEAAPPAESASAKPEVAKPAAKQVTISFKQEIVPFLDQYCAGCHGPGDAKQGYDVTSYAKLLKPGQYGPLVVPGNLDKSRLAEVIHGMSKSMPPSGAAQPTKEEIIKIKAWIEGGAPSDADGGGKTAQGGGSAKPGRSRKGT